MPLIPIKLRPGINSIFTPTLNEGGYSAASNVRFFEGLPQKDGGYVQFCQANVSIPRAMKAWTALSGNSYLAIAGSAALNVFTAGSVFNITPNTVVNTIPISINTTAGSQTIQVNDAVTLPQVGRNIRFRNPISVGGLVLFGSYIVTTINPGVSYQFTSPVAATANVTNGGSGRVFTANGGVGPIIVTQTAHGLFSGQIVQVPATTIVSGVTLHGNYITTVIDANTYSIAPNSNTIGPATVAEQGGNLSVLLYMGGGGSQNVMNASNWTLDNWGEFLMACPRRGPVFQWQPALGTASIPPDITSAPQSNSFIFVSAQAQQLVCCGTIDHITGLFDPMLTRFSDTGDFTNFIPTVGDQAGSFRLAFGSELRAALSVPGQNFLWSDTTLYSMQYVQPPLVYGFQPVGHNCGADGPHAVGIAQEQIFWKSQNQFMTIGAGGPTIVPCPVWDQVFPNQDLANLYTVTCETNSFFGEIGWSVPQTDGTYVFARLKISGPDAGTWTASAYHHHTAWIDQNPFGSPIGAHEDGFIDQHEVGVDANGAAAATSLTTGVIMIAEGTETTFFDYLIPDINWLAPGTLNLTVLVYDYPNKPPRMKGPFPMTPVTQTVRCRGRGRGLQFQFSGNDLGSNWRLGNMRFHGFPDGKR